MHNKPVKDWDYFYFGRKYFPIPTKWQLFRALGKTQLSPHAQLKLEWIIFYHTVGRTKVTQTARHFGITRKTLHKWLARFDEKHLGSLEERSRAPEKTRTRTISPEQKTRIKHLRQAHLRWGKMKLQALYKAAYQEPISSWKIQMVIQDEQLYFDKKQTKKLRLKRKHAQHKKRITQLTKKAQVHYLWHVDTVVFTLPQGGYRYLLTAIDDTSKLAYARIYASHSSKQAADFLRRLHYLTQGEIINLHHDNGSEFMLHFAQACKEFTLPQYFSRAYTPKDNAVLERFNRTIQEECVELMPIGLDDIADANECITDWLIEYNSLRPHQALDYLTPLQYIDTTKLSPMSSSQTHN